MTNDRYDANQNKYLIGINTQISHSLKVESIFYIHRIHDGK